MISKKKYRIKISVFIFLLVLISGCGMWTDFKTYFNTYYNANKLFETVEKDLIKNRKSLFAFGDERITGNQKSLLEDVIKKTSNILQFHAESSYFDDALLMTGKSFYYQQNFTRALRKFKELYSLKDSELHLEAEMWIGKTELKLRSFSKGLETLSKAKQAALENEDENILKEIYRTQIGYLLLVEKNDEAISLAEEFLQTDIDNELKAEIQYEIGLLYKKNKNYKKALQAFKNVLNYSPTFEIEFNSKFELAKMEKENGNIEKSLEMFNDLKNEDKFSNRWGDIELEIGKVYYKNNEIENALDQFAIVDTTYQGTEAGGDAAFYRGEIIENYYHNYDSAMVFYKKAISKASREIADKANSKTKTLRKYLQIKNKIKSTDTKILYATDEEAFIQDSLEYVEKIKLDSLKTAGENENRKRNTQKRKTITPQNIIKKPQRPNITADSLYSLKSKYLFELANLLFTEFDNPDSAFTYYQKALDEDETTSDAPKIYYAMGNYYLLKGDSLKAKEMFEIVYDNYKDDPIMNEAAKQLGKPIFDFDKDEVAEQYIQAEAKYDSSDYEGAIKSFFKIYHENPKSKYAAKSLYTIGWIYENNLNKPDKAAAVYDTLNLKYRSSEFARKVVVKLTGYKQEQRRLQAIQDSIKKANEIKNAQPQTDSTNVKNSVKADEKIKDEVQVDSVKKNLEKKLKKIPELIE